MSTETDPVLFELRSDGVGVITLNRPGAMNAWTQAMGTAYFARLRQCAADPAVKVIVVTGAGRAWCAGADMRGLQSLSGGDGSGEAAAGDVADAGDDHHWHTTSVPKPVIAAINGHAVGVGITYPLLCDVRIVALDAKVQFAFVRRGAIPELASHAILPRVVGFSTAADLLLSGRMFSGADALAM